MYHELYGAGGTPLLLLHGGLFGIEQQFGALIPSLSTGRSVIATDFHGRTNDIDRPLNTRDLASDVTGLFAYLDVREVDAFGFSVGGAVALHLAVNRPDLACKLIVSSVSFRPNGDRGGNAKAAPTLITVGDCDMVKPEHAVRFLQLRGGNVNGDFESVPALQLAVFRGTTHFFGLARTELVREVVTTFLDSPAPSGWQDR